MLKPILFELIDSHQYVNTNCYQHQFSEILHSRFDLRSIEIDNLTNSHIPKNVNILSRLRLRTITNNLLRLKQALSDCDVMIYDQDPWASFLIDSPYRGAYQRINETLNVKTFLNISHWWRDRVLELGIPSRFVQVWTLPRYCRRPVPWNNRQHGAVFCGTMYPRRQTFFDELAKLGFNVKMLPVGQNYPTYLNEIANSRVAVRSERLEWTIDVAGNVYTINKANALWKRDVETAAQGCFSMRDMDDELMTWNLGNVHTIVPFNNVEHAAEQLERILTMSANEANDLARQGVEAIRSAPGWSVTCDVVEELVST